MLLFTYNIVRGFSSRTKDLYLRSSTPRTAGRANLVLSSHWKATGHFFGRIIQYTNLDLKGGAGGVPALRPLWPLRSRFLYRNSHVIFLQNCPVAFQWPSGFGPSDLCPFLSSVYEWRGGFAAASFPKMYLQYVLMRNHVKTNEKP